MKTLKAIEKMDFLIDSYKKLDEAQCNEVKVQAVSDGHVVAEGELTYKNRELYLELIEACEMAKEALQTELLSGHDCSKCSRRAWYQRGYEDGKRVNNP